MRGGEWVTILNRVVGIGFLRRGPLNQGLKEVRELAVQMNLRGCVPGQGNSLGKGPKAGPAWLVGVKKGNRSMRAGQLLGLFTRP